MNTVRWDGKEDPTGLESKFVGHELPDESRYLRGVLADLLKWLKHERAWPEIDGDLSSWICHMHGLADISEGRPLEFSFKGDELSSTVNFINQLFGPGVDLRKVVDAVAQSRAMMREKMSQVVGIGGKADEKTLKSLFSSGMSDFRNIWGVPPELQNHFGISYSEIIKLLRAVRATIVCLVLNGEHPITLIARASKRDRGAVLSLVKTDSLFMSDRCTQSVIRKAQLQDDTRFLAQLGRAVKKRAKLRRRDVMHVYFCVLLLLELNGVRLPPLNELWTTLDPLGSEYKSLWAFERDFQRRREDLAEIIANGEKELSARP